ILLSRGLPQEWDSHGRRSDTPRQTFCPTTAAVKWPSAVTSAMHSVHEPFSAPCAGPAHEHSTDANALGQTHDGQGVGIGVTLGVAVVGTCAVVPDVALACTKEARDEDPAYRR